MKRNPRQPGFRRALFGIVLYLSGFAGVLMLVCSGCTSSRPSGPRQVRSNGMTRSRKKSSPPRLRWSWLLCCSVLFAGLLLTFRMGRFFFPRAQPPRPSRRNTSTPGRIGPRLNTADLPPDEEDDEHCSAAHTTFPACVLREVPIPFIADGFHQRRPPAHSASPLTLIRAGGCGLASQTRIMTRVLSESSHSLNGVMGSVAREACIALVTSSETRSSMLSLKRVSPHSHIN